MLDLFARDRVARLVDPAGKGLAGLGVTPTSITLVGLAITLVGSVLVAIGWLFAGALTIGIGSALDMLDGAVARAGGMTSIRGALVDSLSDRTGETAMWSGLAYHLAGDPIAVALCCVALGASYQISYLRSKAEANGLEGRGGLMGRTERVILYCVGVGLGWPVIMAVTMVALTLVTVGQRFRLIWRRIR